MFVTLETALLVHPGTPRGFEGTTAKVLKAWSDTPRTAFFVNTTSEHVERSFLPIADRRVVSLATDWECLIGTTCLLSEARRRNVQRLLFLGGEPEGNVETNIRAASSFGLYCLLFEDDDQMNPSPMPEFRKRISRYCDFVSLETLEREIPLTVHSIG